MKGRKYVICDIEATGLEADRDLIEIALITFVDDKVVDVYETLVNPLRAIPEFISNLTTISNRSLKEAPKFYEVADAIRMRLEGNIFVSHNTDFDLGLLKKKYLEMGQELNIKEFCTLKASQQEVPGLSNYNLDALCSFFGIKIKDRHTAIGDASATLELFKEIQQLRFRIYPKPLYLPHHEKCLKRLSSRAGLIFFKNSEGRTLKVEPSFNMEQTARELLKVKRENHDLLTSVSQVEGEETGLALIAELRKLQMSPSNPRWAIGVETYSNGEKYFNISPYKKGRSGLWYFDSLNQAKKKLKLIRSKMQGQKFAYREGGKSKEEILRNNHQIEQLSKSAKLPADNLIILGEGRVMGEKALVLVREGHVLGYGYTTAPDEVIYRSPDQFLTRRFAKNLGLDQVTMKYLRVLKNLRHKTESWRSLAEVTNI